MSKHPIEILQELLKESGVKQKVFADLLGVSPIELSRYLHRKTNMKLDLYHEAILLLQHIPKKKEKKVKEIVAI